MASNFDFLQEIDSKLYEIIKDGEKLFRDGYFNQSIVQLRIFAEKLAKKALNIFSTKIENLSDSTFDDVLHCLKDAIKEEREKEFVDDLFFIKQEGNKCAHGEIADATVALETIKRAFEASINYCWFLKKDEKIDKLRFDDALLITQKKSNETKIVDKYLKAAAQNLEQEELKAQKLKEEKDLIKSRVKERIKEAKNTRKTIDKPKKETKRKTSQKEKPQNKKIIKKSSKTKKTKIKKLTVLFWIFVTISLFFLTKMLFFF